jgi:hypothetical protein
MFIGFAGGDFKAQWAVSYVRQVSFRLYLHAQFIRGSAQLIRCETIFLKLPKYSKMPFVCQTVIIECHNVMDVTQCQPNGVCPHFKNRAC